MPRPRSSLRATPDEVAGTLQVSVGLLVRRLRQVRVASELTPSESSVLARLDRIGPRTVADLRRIEQVTPQSIGATIGVLESRGFVVRRPDPNDGRRAVISATSTGLEELRSRRNAKAALMAGVLAEHFDTAELEQLLGAASLLERLAEHL